MLIKLSHNLSESTPFPGGLPGPQLRRLYDLDRGDACNSFYLTTSNHAGTHVDGPNHFDPSGRKICDYDLSELVFTKPALVDIQASQDELITPRHFDNLSACRSDCDLLFVRTGFARYRSDADIYIEHNPGFSAAAADLLMRQFSQLKAIGMDFASAAATAHMKEGCEAHRVFLGCGTYSQRPVLLVEDVCFPESLPAISKVYLIPWFFEGLDSAPCTLFAEVNESVQS